MRDQAERVLQLIDQGANVRLFEQLEGFTARLNRHAISSLRASGMVLAIADDNQTMSLEAAGKNVATKKETKEIRRRTKLLGLDLRNRWRWQRKQQQR